VELFRWYGTKYSMWRHGAAVIRRFISVQESSELRDTVNTIYSVLADYPLIPDPDIEENFRRWNGVALSTLPDFLGKNHPGLALRYARLLEIVCKQVIDVFGRQWIYFPRRSFLRRHVGVGKKVPWHIDADAAHIDRDGCFNVWLPLESVGTTSPSLEVIYDSHWKMRSIPLLDGPERYRENDFVRTIGSSSTPTLELGDALAFDQFTLHRTQCIGSENTIRTACEFRFVRRKLATLATSNAS
jgi:hypothetical protein